MKRSARTSICPRRSSKKTHKYTLRVRRWLAEEDSSNPGERASIISNPITFYPYAREQSHEEGWLAVFAWEASRAVWLLVPLAVCGTGFVWSLWQKEQRA